MRDFIYFITLGSLDLRDFAWYRALKAALFILSLPLLFGAWLFLRKLDTATQPREAEAATEYASASAASPAASAAPDKISEPVKVGRPFKLPDGIARHGTKRLN